MLSLLHIFILRKNILVDIFYLSCFSFCYKIDIQLKSSFLLKKFKEIENFYQFNQTINVKLVVYYIQMAFQLHYLFHKNLFN